MGRRIFYNEIKENIEKEGYEILVDKEICANEMFEIKCPKGHMYKTNYYRFKNGSRCPHCAGNVKLTYEYVKKYVENNNFKLLSKEYKKSSDKLTFECSKGHIFERSFIKFKTNKKCPYCSGFRKWKYNEVKNYIESFNYELLSDKYNNINDKLKMKCNENHIFYMNFNNFKNGKRRCPICANNIKHEYVYVKNYIESFGYELLSNEYMSANKKIEVKCTKGHKYSVKFSNFKTGYRCPVCGTKRASEKQKYPYEYVKNYIESFGYELLSDNYINIKTKLNIMCDKNHKFSMTFDNFKTGYRCPTCGNSSKGEEIIFNYLKENNVKFLHDRAYFKDLLSPLGNPLRPDFILPDLRIWIEYDGEQHFKIIDFFGGFDGFINLKIKDTIKNEYAKSHGYKMIRIPYWDFNNIETILNKELKIS